MAMRWKWAIERRSKRVPQSGVSDEVRNHFPIGGEDRIQDPSARSLQRPSGQLLSERNRAAQEQQAIGILARALHSSALLKNLWRMTTHPSHCVCPFPYP